jgi:hypothetical protein
VFRNINMKRVSATKNSRTHQEPVDVFEYCFWPGDGKTPGKTLRGRVSKILIRPR